jgi:hypothetical protein
MGARIVGSEDDADKVAVSIESSDDRDVYVHLWENAWEY